MKLDSDTLEVSTTQDGRIIVEPNYVDYLRNHGYTIEGVQEAHIVPSENDKGSAHLVMRVETYQYPMDDPRLDVAEDTLTLDVCDCGDYQFRKGVDVSEKTLAEGSNSSCKHLRSAFRVQKAQEDDKQATF